MNQSPNQDSMNRKWILTANPVISLLRANATLLALVLIAVVLGCLDSTFFTPRNMSNLTRQVTTIGIISVGMTMVILIEGIDLSVGSVVGLAAIVVTLLMEQGLNIWVSVVITMLSCGLLVGLWNGFWVAHYRIPPFIITLGMMTIARGAALTLSKGSSIPVTEPFFPKLGGSYIPRTISAVLIGIISMSFVLIQIYRLQQRKRYQISTKLMDLLVPTLLVVVSIGFFCYIFLSYRGIPMPVAIFGVIVLVGALILKSTRLGRNMYAMGGNEQAAHLSGINVYRTKLFVFTIASSLATLSGILLASRLNGASPNLGTMFELDAIASVVIGGTSLSGGSGTISGTVIGAFIIGVLNNGMSLLGIPMFYQLVFKGVIIIFAVWFDVINKRRR